METFQLLHLARLCRKSTVHASAASIVVRRKSENSPALLDSCVCPAPQDLLKSGGFGPYLYHAYTAFVSPLLTGMSSRYECNVKVWIVRREKQLCMVLESGVGLLVYGRVRLTP